MVMAVTYCCKTVKLAFLSRVLVVLEFVELNESRCLDNSVVGISSCEVWKSWLREERKEHWGGGRAVLIGSFW